MQYTVLASRVLNAHWRSQYGANGATAPPPNAKDHFCKSCKSDEIFCGAGRGGKLAVSLSLLITDASL